MWTKIRTFLTSWKTSSREGANMPGVADAIRKTGLQQEHQKRKQEMEQLLTIVREGRLHEADERQLELLKLALEINALLDPKSGGTPAFDYAALASALKEAVQEALQNTPAGDGILRPAGTSRPQMKHTSLTDFSHTQDDVSISHGDTLGETKEGSSDSADKLEKLKKIKGGS